MLQLVEQVLTDPLPLTYVGDSCTAEVSAHPTAEQRVSSEAETQVQSDICILGMMLNCIQGAL